MPTVRAQSLCSFIGNSVKAFLTEGSAPPNGSMCRMQSFLQPTFRINGQYFIRDSSDFLYHFSRENGAAQ